MTPFAQLENLTKEASLKIRAKAFGHGVLDPLDKLISALRGKLGEVPDGAHGARQVGQGAATGAVGGAVGAGIGGLLRSTGVIDGKDKDLKKEASAALLGFRV
jgi:hypothetical protein